MDIIRTSRLWRQIFCVTCSGLSAEKHSRNGWYAKHQSGYPPNWFLVFCSEEATPYHMNRRSVGLINFLDLECMHAVLRCNQQPCWVRLIRCKMSAPWCKKRNISRWHFSMAMLMPCHWYHRLHGVRTPGLPSSVPTWVGWISGEIDIWASQGCWSVRYGTPCGSVFSIWLTELI